MSLLAIEMISHVSQFTLQAFDSAMMQHYFSLIFIIKTQSQILGGER